MHNAHLGAREDVSVFAVDFFLAVFNKIAPTTRVEYLNTDSQWNILSHIKECVLRGNT